MRTEPNHRKLIMRNRVIGPMQLSKILGILTDREQNPKLKPGADQVATPKVASSKKSSQSSTHDSNNQQANPALPDLRQREITRVTHLDLSGNDLGDAGLAAVAKWIEMGSLMLKDTADVVIAGTAELNQDLNRQKVMASEISLLADGKK